jgi:outer membrane protein OmpA-like peptidoglycan-associated protein
MFPLVTLAVATLAFGAVDGGDFSLHDADKGKSKDAHGAHPSQIEATKHDAAMKLVVIDKDKGPVKGVVIVLTSPLGTKYYTDETDAEGYGEVLVPNAQKYELTYLSLGRQDIAATVTVTDEPKQSVKLTLRFKRLPPPPPFILTGVNFDTGKATIKRESYDRLDIVYEFLAHKKSARVEISGHTDNVGKTKANKTLSAARAEACRAYLIGKGIDSLRMTTAGWGDEKPIAPNDTDEGRQKNRRIEVVEQRPASP